MAADIPWLPSLTLMIGARHARTCAGEVSKTQVAYYNLKLTIGLAIRLFILVSY